MPTQAILAIDLGTSGPKVALVSPGGSVLAAEREETKLLLLTGGGAEQDPADWWAAVCRAARRLAAWRRAPENAPVELLAVCCTAQWSGTVAVDSRGRALDNAIIWMDTRGLPFVRRITGGPLRIEGYGVDKLWAWVRRTGGIPTRSGKDSIAHLLYLKHCRPDIYQAAYKFLEPKDYLNLRLTGRFASSPETMTLHWVTDNRRVDAVDYDPELLRRTGIAREKLPDLLPATGVLGPLTAEAAADLDAPAGLPVLLGTPDIHSAAIGAGAVDFYAPHLYIGTSAWMTCHVPFKKTDLLHNMASLPAALPGRYLLTNEQELAGGCLTWLRDEIIQPGTPLAGAPDAAGRAFGRMDELAASSAPGSDGVLFTPWLKGERTPVDDPHVRGGFHNISLHSTRGDMVRAVLEGVALNCRWLLASVERFTARRLDSIALVGGGASSPLWCQIMADVLDRRVRQVADPFQVNTRGVALLASLGLGLLPLEKLSQHAPTTAEFSPTPALRPLYARRFRAFTELYRSSRRLARRVNGG